VPGSVSLSAATVQPRKRYRLDKTRPFAVISHRAQDFRPWGARADAMHPGGMQSKKAATKPGNAAPARRAAMTERDRKLMSVTAWPTSGSAKPTSGRPWRTSGSAWRMSGSGRQTGGRPR
jgi:hypothetical protein